ncbi:MAG: Maf family protein, partial [Candidatus Eremiobacterales bacterium]
LSGRWHVVHTGFTLVDRSNGKSVSGVESSRVKFAALDDATIARYVATGEPRDKAGAYGLQGKGALLVERVDGDFYTVMGLPLARVNAAARELGREIG